jgi:type II secretory pathway pseudopilin PulG
MKRLIDVLIVVAVLALIAAGVMWWLLSQDDESESDRVGGQKPSEQAASMISSTGVEKNIADRLTARAGREVKVECPPQVDELVGTTFECQAYFAGDTDVATVAQVEITGGGGQFEWTSENAETPEPSATPQ